LKILTEIYRLMSGRPGVRSVSRFTSFSFVNS